MPNPDGRDSRVVPKEMMDQFLEVSQAFKTIRDQRLFTEQFHSFDEYCRAKFGKSGAEVDWLIAQAEVELRLRKVVPALQ
jgi:hypothetical protein